MPRPKDAPRSPEGWRASRHAPWAALAPSGPPRLALWPGHTAPRAPRACQRPDSRRPASDWTHPGTAPQGLSLGVAGGPAPGARALPAGHSVTGTDARPAATHPGPAPDTESRSLTGPTSDSPWGALPGPTGFAASLWEGPPYFPALRAPVPPVPSTTVRSTQRPHPFTCRRLR